MIAFYLAQGAAVFLTGFGLSRLVGSRGWLAKLAWMIFSYALWSASPISRSSMA
jgi:hypothetical protein